MKASVFHISPRIALAVVGSLPLLSHAADITKANNNDPLANGSSWAGGSAPTSAHTAVFDATYAQTGTLGTGGPLSWGGIKVTTFTSGANPVNIDNTTTTNHVGIGAGGIDMSAAARNLRIFSAQGQDNQTWDIGAGRTLEIGVDRNGPLPAGHKVTLAGTGTLRLIGGALSLSSTSASAIGVLESYSGTLNVTQNLNVGGKFSVGETGTAVFNHSAGIANVNSAIGGFGAGLNIGHRIGGNGTYNLSGGTLNAAAAVTIGAGGGNTGVLSITGGTANFAGLILKTSDSASATVNLTGGLLNLGPGGITSLADATNRTINLGGGTLGATADWSSAEALVLTGTGGDTIIHTLDAVDETTPRTITLSGSCSGTGGLLKTGAGTLTLSGANSYTGTTTVSGGTLAVNGTSLADASSLVIDGGVVAPTATETVGTLFFGATQQAAGTWGATDSGATHIDNTRFSGTDGVILVTTGPGGGGFESWAATNGADGQGFGDDHDNDGVSNGIEYFLGGPNGNTTGFTALPGVTNTGGTLSVTWTMAADYTGTYDTDFVVETSETLSGAWTTEIFGSTVTIDGYNVTYTFPAEPAKRFVRLKVTGP